MRTGPISMSNVLPSPLPSEALAAAMEPTSCAKLKGAVEERRGEGEVCCAGQNEGLTRHACFLPSVHPSIQPSSQLPAIASSPGQPVRPEAPSHAAQDGRVVLQQAGAVSILHPTAICTIARCSLGSERRRKPAAQRFVAPALI